MRMSAEEFLSWEHRAISLMGMSGVGKTYLANKLPRAEWFHFSGDYRIGTKYLSEPILDNIKKKAMAVDFLRDLLRSDSIFIANNISVHNLEPLSTFLGKIGNPKLGGLSIDEFRERQRLHREAEIGAMFDVKEFIAKVRDMYGYAHFINDMGGSVCELDGDEVLEMLAEQTLIVYIRADHDMEAELIRRQIDNPKPLYYKEAFFDAKLAEYFEQENLRAIEQIEPDEFVQWIFPKLVAHRRPLYQSIADRYGYTIEAHQAEQVHKESDFLDLIAATLRAAHGREQRIGEV